MRHSWSPFDRNGNLRVVTYSDPWWKRLYARLRGEPLWHQVGYMTDDAITPKRTINDRTD